MWAPRFLLFAWLQSESLHGSAVGSQASLPQTFIDADVASTSSWVYDENYVTPMPSPTRGQTFSTAITRLSDKMAYSLKKVDNEGNAIQFGDVDTTNVLVSTATDSSVTTVVDNYELEAGCYVLETLTTAVLTKYTRPDLWSWHVGNQVAGYGFDAGVFGVGGELCGLPKCFSDCRQQTSFVNEWSPYDQCSNYLLLLRLCMCGAAKDITMLFQQLKDLGCATPHQQVLCDDTGYPVKKFTYIVESHIEYNTTLSLLLVNTAVSDNTIPPSFRREVEGAGVATFLGVYPWSKVHLTSVNGNPVDDVITSRNLRGEDAERRLQANISRKLTRLTFSVDAYVKDEARQQDRYTFLENKSIEDFTMLQNQLRSTVTLLRAPSFLVSVSSYSKTHEVVDSVQIQIEIPNTAPDLTPAPTPVNGYNDDDMEKPIEPDLVPIKEPSFSVSDSDTGGIRVSLYIASRPSASWVSAMLDAATSAIRNKVNFSVGGKGGATAVR